MLHGEWFEAALYGSPLRQIVASVAIVVGMPLLLWGLRAGTDRLTGRFNRAVLEATELVAAAVGIVGAAVLLAEVWAIPFVYERALDIVSVDRWQSLRGVVSAAILVSSYLLVRAVQRSFDRLHADGAITHHQQEVAYHVAGAGIFAVAGVAVLSVWGIALTNLILGAGVATAVLGLAAQRTVAAVIAGFFLLVSRPFRVGDWIEVVDDGDDDASGIVEDVTISHTKIRTFNDEHVLVPNDQVTSNRLTNYTRNDRLRIDVDVGVDYETDLEAARELVASTVGDLEPVSEVRDPKVVLKRFDESAVVLGVQFWIEEPARRRAWRARTAAIGAIKEAFDREGITIPFPQRTHDLRSGELAVEATDDTDSETDGSPLGIGPGTED